jgi:hypothetical protein
MTNKDMVPRPAPGPAPRDRNAPKPGTPAGADASRETAKEREDPPDSPQLTNLRDRK